MKKVSEAEYEDHEEEAEEEEEVARQPAVKPHYKDLTTQAVCPSLALGHNYNMSQVDQPTT